jgi:phosphofructokinase-like protein
LVPRLLFVTSMRIGILTGGGDAPGLNAAIRAVVKSAANHGAETIGIEDGFAGLIDCSHWRGLSPKDVPGILRLGGTILGTTNRRNPLAYPVPTGGVVDYSVRCIETFHRLELDALVVIGGDGTLAIANEFCKRGVPIVCVPKTIDNDIAETMSSFGFDTAVSFATDAIDRLHTTAEAHHRVIIVEVMGRYAGWIALHAGVAGGADVILIPEIPYDLDKVAQHLLGREALGARFSIVVAAEGAIAVGAGHTIRQPGSASAAERLGGIGEQLITDLERKTNKEMRSVMLGHLQRGGVPTSADRLLATRFGARALELVLEHKWGTMVALQPPDIVAVPLAKVVDRVRTVPPDCDLIRAARAVGVAFGN